MSLGPNTPTPEQFAQMRKAPKPTQAPVPKGTILQPTAAQFAQMRKVAKKPTQAPVLKGTILQPTAAQFSNMRRFTAPHPAPIDKSSPKRP
jgi:hypothetical protein